MPKKDDRPERVFGYELHPDTLLPINRPLDLTVSGDYGADPIGENMFRMIPSGDIVTFEERNLRLRKFNP